MKSKESCIVKIELDYFCSLEIFEKFNELGRFVIRDMGKTIGVGMVKYIKNIWYDSRFLVFNNQ